MTRNFPYITAKALIRYTEAKAPERQRIVRQFRDEPYPPFKGWYGGALEGAIRRYIAGGGKDDEPLRSLELVLEQRPYQTDDEESKLIKQLEAIECMRLTSLSALTRQARILISGDKLAPFEIEGVRVSVRPTNLVKSRFLGEKHHRFGVALPYISSTKPLGDEAGKMFGSLLHWYSEETLAHLGETDHRLSYVIDVFERTVHGAPKAHIQRRKILEASCIEYASMWTTLPEAKAAKRAKKSGKSQI